MKIVIIDGYTLNPGDLSWDGLRRFGEVVIYERTTADEVVERCKDAEVVLTNKVAFPRAVIEQLPKLRYIGVTATGYNIIDVAAAHEKGVVVTNVPAYASSSVAQLVFALLLELTHHVGDHSRGVFEGKWSKSIDFSYWEHPLLELKDLTFGIVGYGDIGKEVGAIAKAFHMKVLPYSRANSEVQLLTLLQESDVISLHCPLTPETQKIINKETLSQMKKTVLLINTSRGGLIDEVALAEALNQGTVGGAALDVLSSEPPNPSNPLLTAKNCIITPHIAWATLAARKRLILAVVENLGAFLSGIPKNTL